MLNLWWVRLVAAILSFCSLVVVQNANAQAIRNDVSFQWADTQSSGNDPATLQSVTIDGVVFDTLSLPSDYEMIQVGPGGDSTNRIRQNGATVENDSSDPTWNATARAAFSSRNLNFFFEASRSNDNDEICNNLSAVPGTRNQIQRLSYGSGIVASTGSVLAVTERNANNCYYIRIFGIPAGGGPEQELGGTFVDGGSVLRGSQVAPPEPNSDYWSSGRITGNDGTIGIALFLLDPLVQAGAIITSVDFIAANRDHGDGKIFILNTSASIIANDDVSPSVNGADGGTNIINVLSNDDLRGFPPTASSATIRVVTPAADPGITLDVSTGEVSVASGVPAGDYQIVYEICETASPANCDTATVFVAVTGLNIIKQSIVISDPSNGTSNPKAVPGAVVRYCIQVINQATSVSIESIAITDDLGSMPVTFVPDSIRVNAEIDADNCDFSTGSSGGSFSGSTVTATLNDLPPGDGAGVYFDVIVN